MTPWRGWAPSQMGYYSTAATILVQYKTLVNHSTRAMPFSFELLRGRTGPMISDRRSVLPTDANDVTVPSVLRLKLLYAIAFMLEKVDKKLTDA